MIMPNYIIFDKFLPDCHQTSFKSYLEQLTRTLKNCRLGSHDSESLDRHLRWILLEIEPLYDKYMTYLSLLDEHRFHFKFWEYREKKNGYCDVEIYLTKIPHILGSLEPPINERELYKELLFTLVTKNLLDCVNINEYDAEGAVLGTDTIRAKPHWFYLTEKITHFEMLQKMLREERSYGESSRVYEFAQQAGKILSIKDSNIELTLPDFADLSALENAVANDVPLPGSEITQEYLKKYDQMLLDAWGKDKFSENLIPLGVCLEEWLASK